jgi:branched-chain amino acid transport system ATP-binding protein
MHFLELERVDVYYGQVQAVRGVSLHIGRGEMVALLGANGAGKTTTLRAISGMIAPRRGSITFGGRNIAGLPPQQVVRHGITHLPEGRELFPSLSVMENLRMGHWPRRGDRSGFQSALDNVMELFPRLRERSSQAAGTLSGGEQQMLGVARALMPSPSLLLVDELSLGLAPMVVAQLFDVLKRVNEQGTAVLLVEQFVHMALAHSDRAYVLAKGELVASGRSEELRRDSSLVDSYLGGADLLPAAVE